MDPQLLRAFDRFIKDSTELDPQIEQSFRQAGVILPSDYWELMRSMNGGEGYIGEAYMRLYPGERLQSLNELMNTTLYAPGLFVFGSNASGIAWGFNIHKHPATIVQIPFIPMLWRYAHDYGISFEAFVLQLSHRRTMGFPRPVNRALIGKEVHAIKPVVFGGDPKDPENLVPLEPEEYARQVAYWNGKYRELGEQQNA